MPNCRVKNQNGQALLIVLLGMAVVLTLVLSIVSRSVTDVSITSKDEESLRAFSAAEAGIEKVLLTGVGIGGSFAESNSSFEAVALPLGNEDKFYLPGTYNSGEVATLWFVGHDTNGNLSCAGNPNPCVDANEQLKLCFKGAGNPALELAIYYDTTGGSLNGNYAGVKIARSTFDSVVRNPQNNFDTAVNGCGLVDNDPAFNKQTSAVYSSFYDLGVDAGCIGKGCLLFARIKVLYAPTEIIAGLNSSTFPSQGTKIESLGYSGDATRKVEATQTFSTPLDIFENAVFSNSGDITK